MGDLVYTLAEPRIFIVTVDYFAYIIFLRDANKVKKITYNDYISAAKLAF